MRVGRLAAFRDSRNPGRWSNWGSLQRTRHFLEPWDDFKSWIVALSRQDWRTIHDYVVAIDRSIYRSLFHALPLEMQAEFGRQHADLFPNGRRLRYTRLAETLIAYLEDTLAEHWQLFGALQAKYPSNLEGMPPLEQLWLTNGNGSARLRSGGIRFGSDVIALHGILGRLVSPSPDAGSSLLAECRTQLETADPGDGREWTDQIF